MAGVAASALVLAGCGGRSVGSTVPGASPRHGNALIGEYGCGGCHTIGGVDGADGQVGPSLQHFVEHRFIAGQLPNTVDGLVRWIQDPRKIQPGTLMPDLGVTEDEAKDIAAYLYSQ